jgi:acetyl-CoA/propionyl-CoA carboxylase biotin carboxyl carrier protein
VFSSVLIANRGEIAVRIARTLERLGVRSIAVYSDADTDSLHTRRADRAVRIGPAPARQSYLDVDAIINAAVATGAEAIHPGYGFLSESPALARACAAAGVVFIGPSPEAIEAMGDKIRAKQTVAAAGVPTVPGRTEPGLSDMELLEAIDEIGFPALLKPSAGGGGKGMRLLDSADDLAAVVASARREAASSFGDDTLFVERYLPAARHLEVQVLGDRYGTIVHLGERECSLQRRHQKIIEEAPSPAVDEELRRRLGEEAVAVARAGGYENAGTVEFIASAADPREFYFMEMNSRLQVEHPVTEMVWGVDLVELQLRVAAGEPLGIAQGDLVARGHAVEARVYAEDPGNGFIPTGGKVLALYEPQGPSIRIDSGIEGGDSVSSSYDPMLAKVIAWGQDREEALAVLRSSLGRYVLLGTTTNVGFLCDLLDLDEVRSGTLDTGLVERELDRLGPSEPDLADLGVAARVAVEGRSVPVGVWDLSGWRLGGQATSRWRAHSGGTDHAVELTRAGRSSWSVAAGGGSGTLEVIGESDGGLLVAADGTTRHYRTWSRDRTTFVAREGRIWRFDEAEPHATGLGGEEAGGHVTSPMPGIVTAILVEPGDAVAAGTTVAVVEAMKMEHSLAAPTDGEVAAVVVAVGDQVTLGQVLVELTGDEGDGDVVRTE